MDMFAGEKTLLEGGNGALRLTSHRIRLELQGGGHSRTVSMTLDAVASCGLVVRAYPLLLVSGIILAVLATALLVVRGDASALVVFGLAIFLLIAYFITHSAVLEIRSAGDTIQVAMKAKRDEVIAFIDAVENAKLAMLQERGGAGVRAA